jgi:hypothetical protein
MAKTVVGLFDNFAEAQNVVQELVDTGFRREDISLVANDAKGEYRRYADGGAAKDAVGAGAVSGGVVGGVLGLLAGTGLLVIPGIGPVLAAGPLAAGISSTAAALGATAVGVGLGAAAGGLVGGLVSAGVPEDDANYYAEGVRRGGALVTVAADDANVNSAYAAMQRHGAVDIKKRGADWRESGWSGFDPNVAPYRGASDPDAKSPDRAPGDARKVGAGIGGVGGAATGAAIGAVGGPIGAAAGGAIGAVAGGAFGAATATAFETHDAEFRTHYRNSPNMGSQPFDYYVPGYRFGYDLSGDHRFIGLDWSAVEPEARRHWEAEHPNTWQQFKDSIRYAWEEARGAR